MATIWKFPLAVDGVVKLPAASVALGVQMVRGVAVLYAIVDPTQHVVVRRFPVYGTGHELPPDPGRYLGTFQMDDGLLVFHVFDTGTQSGRQP